MHEIVTLQLGNNANYVSTHFWNVQESYFTYGSEEESPVDHDVHFRPGVAPDGTDTYTPRTVIYDLKGAFGTLRRENALYELQGSQDRSQQGQWSGRTNVIQEPAIPPSLYQQHLEQGLDPPPLTAADVRFWPDFNRVFYHPRSIVKLHDHELNSTLMPFERWTTGEELFLNLDREHDLLDRDLRPFLEECDQIQGLQMLSNTDDAWGGFAAKYLEQIHDELGKTNAWVFGIEDGKPSETVQAARLRSTNVAHSLHQIASQASMYVPITTMPGSIPSYLKSMDPTSKWHTSALAAATIECVTLPTRLRGTTQGHASYSEMESALNNDGKRRIAHLAFSAEDPTILNAPNGNGTHDARIDGAALLGEDEDEGRLAHLDMDMTPKANGNYTWQQRARSDRSFAQVQSLRGHWKAGIELEGINMAARDRFSSGPRVHSYQNELLFPVLTSFPCILHPESKPQYVATQSSLTTSSLVAKRLRSVQSAVSALIARDEREALFDGLATMREEYEEGWDVDSDEDDED